MKPRKKHALSKTPPAWTAAYGQAKYYKDWNGYTVWRVSNLEYGFWQLQGNDLLISEDNDLSISEELGIEMCPKRRNRRAHD